MRGPLSFHIQLPAHAGTSTRWQPACLAELSNSPYTGDSEFQHENSEGLESRPLREMHEYAAAFGVRGIASSGCGLPCLLHDYGGNRESAYTMVNIKHGGNLDDTSFLHSNLASAKHCCRTCGPLHRSRR